MNLVTSVALWPSSNASNISCQIELCLMFICAPVKSHRDWSNAHISATTTTTTVMWYTRSKLECTTKILQKFWLILVCMYLPTLPYGQDEIQGQFLSGVLQIWIQSFPSPRLAEEPSLSYYLPIAGGRIIRFIPFPRVLGLCEMQSASSRVWTCVAMSISYDDNHYTTSASIFILLRSFFMN